MTSSTALSVSVATISAMAVRRMRLRVSAVARGCRQTASRSAPSAIRRSRSAGDTTFGPRGPGRRQPRLQAADLHQAVVPASLELAGHQAVVGVDRVVLPSREVRLVARLGQRQLDLAPRRAGIL